MCLSFCFWTFLRSQNPWCVPVTGVLESNIVTFNGNSPRPEPFGALEWFERWTRTCIWWSNPLTPDFIIRLSRLAVADMALIGVEVRAGTSPHLSIIPAVCVCVGACAPVRLCVCASVRLCVCDRCFSTTTGPISLKLARYIAGDLWMCLFKVWY